ncbi:MAG: peptide deformylase [Acidobacteria bacterium]|nr:peptide deformylase [Acidobacteriota bacterium]
MSILKVARMGHPVLRARARPLERGEILSPGVQKLIDDMIETMTEYQGIGLAAPQVHEDVRLFVAGTKGDADVPQVVLINPEVTVVGSATGEDWEGCLSIPDVRGRVPRALEIRVRALDRRAKTHEFGAHGYLARVLQHENDHLDGILFLDRMTSFESLTFLEEFGRYWSREEVVPE